MELSVKTEIEPFKVMKTLVHKKKHKENKELIPTLAKRKILQAVLPDII